MRWGGKVESLCFGGKGFAARLPARIAEEDAGPSVGEEVAAWGVIAHKNGAPVLSGSNRGVRPVSRRGKEKRQKVRV